jgi:hypothetical protein
MPTTESSLEFHRALQLLHSPHLDELVRLRMGFLFLGRPSTRRPGRILQIHEIHLRATPPPLVPTNNLSPHCIHNANLGRLTHRR